MGGIDLRPTAKDMVLCLNKMCANKCKRYFEYWKPNVYQQSYINPANKYINGVQQKCKCRLEDKQ